MYGRIYYIIQYTCRLVGRPALLGSMQLYLMCTSTQNTMVLYDWFAGVYSMVDWKLEERKKIGPPGSGANVVNDTWLARNRNI